MLVTDAASLESHGISLPYFHEMTTVVLASNAAKGEPSISFPELTKGRQSTCVNDETPKSGSRINAVRGRCIIELLGFPNCLDPAGRSFGPHRILMSQVFYQSDLSQALVNLKPIVPGLLPGPALQRLES